MRDVTHGLSASLVLALAGCDGSATESVASRVLDDDARLSFVPAPDFGGGTVVGCDTFLQDCPAGEKCLPWANDGGSSWNASRCSPVVPDAGAPGEPCSVDGSAVSGLDDCQRGAMCWEVNPETNEGTCVAMLVGSGGHPICANPLDVPYLSAGHALTICLPGCHPLKDACGAAEGCYPSDNGFACMLERAPNKGLAGDRCRWPNDCHDGLTCVNNTLVPDCTGAGCCMPYCDLEAPDCPESTTCQPWSDEPPPTPYQELVGICRV